MIAVDSIRDVTVDDRLRGAVWGQFVGDAAALGTHLIYDLDEIRSKFPRGVIGFEAPIEGRCHFGKKSGETHYGDGALVLWNRSLRAADLMRESLGRRWSAGSIQRPTQAI
jgi:hypothetical protein